jgi:hypothetical protein
LGHQQILGSIYGNTVYPRIKGTVTPEITDGPVSLDKGFLNHILDVFLIADHAREQAGDSPVVFVHQQIECEFVTRLNALNNQQIIVFIGGHSSSKNNWKVKAFQRFRETVADTPKRATDEMLLRKQAQRVLWLSELQIVVKTGLCQTAKPKPEKKRPDDAPVRLMLRGSKRTGGQI